MIWLSALKGISIVGRLCVKVLHASRKIPAIDDLVCRVQASLLNPVIVRRIRKADDPDLIDALQLCARRMPQEFRWEDADIVRWIKQDEKISRNDLSSPREVLLVDKYKTRVVGLLLLHHYPAQKTVFIAYMVIAQGIAGLKENQISTSLLKSVWSLFTIDKVLKDSERVIFEIEDPRFSYGSKQLEQLARIKRLCRMAASLGLEPSYANISYKQPRLTTPQNGSADDHPLLLMSIRIGENICSVVAEKEEAIKQLSFMYNHLYPDDFSTNIEEANEYRQYCEGLYKACLAGLHEKVVAMNPAHLCCDRSIRKKMSSKASVSKELTP